MNPLPNNPNDIAGIASAASASAPGSGTVDLTTPINEKQMMLRLAFAKPNFLPMGYVPTALDVCCGRGKKNWRHQGNISFRKIIRIRVDSYISAPTKQDKSYIVVAIVDDLRLLGGKFLKQDDNTGRWYDIGDSQARDKVGHSLRDQVTALSKHKDRKLAPVASALSSSSSPSSSPSRKQPPESTLQLAAAAAGPAQAPPRPLSASLSAPASLFANMTAAHQASTASTGVASMPSTTTSSYRQKGGGMMDDYNVDPHAFITYQQAVSQRRSEPCIPASTISSLLLSSSFAKRPSMGLDEHVTHGLVDVLEPAQMDDLRLLPTASSMMQRFNPPHHQRGGGGTIPPFSFVDAMEQGCVRLEPNFHQPLDASVEPTPIEQMLLHHQQQRQKQQQGVQQQEQKDNNNTASSNRQQKSTLLGANFEPLPDAQAEAVAANLQAQQQQFLYQSFLNNINNNNNNNNNSNNFPPFP
jgi:hypothetical protein